MPNTGRHSTLRNSAAAATAGRHREAVRPRQPTPAAVLAEAQATLADLVLDVRGQPALKGAPIL